MAHHIFAYINIVFNQRNLGDNLFLSRWITDRNKNLCCFAKRKGQNPVGTRTLMGSIVEG